MKKKLSEWLVRLACKLNPQVEVRDGYVARQVGIGIHIAKSDVRKFRSLNPQYKSHRQGLAALVEDTKKKSLLNIVAGLAESGAVDFKVSRTPWTADVRTILKVYVPKKED